MTATKQKTGERESLYERLRDHYTADGMYDLPRRKEALDILKLRFSPEEAQIALSIPVLGEGWTSLSQLAGRTGKGEAELRSKVESLLAPWQIVHTVCGVVVTQTLVQGFPLVSLLFGGFHPRLLLLQRV